MHLVVPKGTLLAIPLNVVHTNPNIWGPDPHVFRPSRWIERKEAGFRCDRELLTFSEGYVTFRASISPFLDDSHRRSPRACIGKAFALTEIKVCRMSSVCFLACG